MKSALLVMMCPGFPADEGDTACLPAVQQFIRALAAREGSGNVAVIAFQYPFTRKKYQWHGISVFALGGKNRGGAMRMITWFRAWTAIRTLRAGHRIRGFLAFWLGECALVSKLCARGGEKVLVWMHGQDVRAGNRYVNRVRPRAAQLIAISKDGANEFERNYGIRPGHIVGNAIDPSVFPQLRQERTIDIFGAGALTPLKNYAEFILAVKEVKRTFPAVRAVIAGKGPEHGKLMAMIRELGLDSNIELAGETGHPETLKCMNEAKIFFHPSGFEGNSSAILEALFSGCSVVAKVPPPAGRIENYFQVSGIKSAAEKITALLSEKRHYARSGVPVFSDAAGAVSTLFTA